MMWFDICSTIFLSLTKKNMITFSIDAFSHVKTNLILLISERVILPSEVN